MIALKFNIAGPGRAPPRPCGGARVSPFLQFTEFLTDSFFYMALAILLLYMFALRNEAHLAELSKGLSFIESRIIQLSLRENPIPKDLANLNHFIDQ